MIDCSNALFIMSKWFQVVIVPSSGDHAMGSSKLEISNIVNFGWDFQYSPGQLVALHKGGIYFAYGLVSPGKLVF